jgi:hypothetical protein
MWFIDTVFTAIYIVMDIVFTAIYRFIDTVFTAIYIMIYIYEPHILL